MATGDEDDNEVQTPVAQRTDVANNIDGGDSAVPVLVDKEDTGMGWADTLGATPRKKKRAGQKWSRSHSPKKSSNPL